MEFASTIFGCILSTAGGYLVEPTLRLGRYLFCSKSILQGLGKEDENLRSTQEHVQQQVDSARRNTEEIETDVQNWLTKVSSVVADVRSLEDEINANESRLNGWCCNWGYKYKLSRRAAKQTSTILKLRDAGKFNNISHPAILPGIEFLAPEGFVTFDSTKFAFDRIIEALKDDGTRIVGLFGMGGVGKTTLATAVGNASKEQKIFDEVVVVVVSHDVKIREIQDRIAESLGLKFEENTEQSRAERLFLRWKIGKKNLLILDDVWEKFDLRTIGIRLDDEDIGCKILVTTRIERVCTEMDCRKKVPLNVLSQKEGMDLLKKHAQVGDDSPVLSHAAEVLKECNGLPLAIVTIGTALRERTIDEWKAMIQQLKKSKLMDADIVDAKLYACLKLSYDYLKSEKTKSCFLLCSLFPEDREIDMEELLRLGPGLGLFEDADSIEDARSQLRAMVNNLIASNLLLAVREGFVKMHDVVRDVALWITSEGENVFMVKAGTGLTDWPKHASLDQCIAISLIENEIEVLPNDLVCPKLSILLLGSYYSYRSEICEIFFKEMKALKVVILMRRKLSLKSLESLANLVSLQLIDCELRDISSMKKLAKLEILSLRNSVFNESFEFLKELSKLRMLDLRYCCLERIPIDEIPKLSRLEQLQITSNSFEADEVEGTNAGRSNANLLEPNLPKGFVLMKSLLKYNIRVNYEDSMESYPKSRRLAISNIECTSLLPYKAFYANVEYLKLRNIKWCYRNIIPSIDETGLIQLKRLSLMHLHEVESIIDMTQQHVPSIAFSNLTYLSLYDVDVREICKGGRPPKGFLENLETLKVDRCDRMSCLFPASLIQRLQKLKEVSICTSNELQDVFQLEGLCYTEENPFLLSSLARLHLDAFPNLSNIWKSPTQQVSLQSLTVIEVVGCHMLRYVFTLNLSRSLLQLQQLKVENCDGLEYIVEIKAEETEDNVAAEGGNTVLLPKLRELRLRGVGKLINFCSENYSSSWPALQVLTLWQAPSLVVEFGANIQTTRETLRTLEIRATSNEFCKAAVAQLSNNNFQNLEDLIIRNCRVRTIFEVEQQFSLSSLKQLKLSGLQDLVCLYKGSPHLLSLPNLQLLDVYNCKRLRHLLSSTLARNLQQLKTIDIRLCEELEQLIVEDNGEVHVQLPFLPNLFSIYVTECDKLKTLFSVSIARRLDLQQLTFLTIIHSPQLEEIFGQKNEAHMTTGDIELQLVFPQLKQLTLESLKSLINFCPSGYHFIFPSLSYLRVSTCPKITTRFLADQNGTVHAQAEATAYR